MSTNADSLSLMIPVEFPADTGWISETTKRYFDRPLDIVFIHVIDSRILTTLERGDIQKADEIYQELKNNSDFRLKEMAESVKEHSRSVQAIMVEGIPSLEIIKLSRDLKMDALLMRIRSGGGGVENLFFGSTTERVIRGSSIPVFCFP